jgi:hypothetical protein
MGSDAVWISVGEHLTEEAVRVFGTTTAQLRASAEWMRSLGVDTVALEATGVYWVAAYEIDEQYGLRPILEEPTDHQPCRNRSTPRSAVAAQVPERARGVRSDARFAPGPEQRRPPPRLPQS